MEIYEKLEAEVGETELKIEINCGTIKQIYIRNG